MATQLSSIKVEASLDAQKYLAPAAAITAANTKMVDSNKALAGSLDATDRKLSGTATGFERFKRSIDPAYASAQKMEAGLRSMQRAIDSGVNISTEQARLLELLRKRYEQATPAANQHTKAISGLSEAHTQLSTQGMEAFHVLRSMTEQMIVGAPPTQILAQHISQLSYAASGPGGLTAAFGQVARLLAGFITPTTVAIAGFAAMGAGFAVLLSRAADNADMLRQFDAVLRGVGPGANATSADLQKIAYDLRAIGLSAKEATAAVREVSNNPAINRANLSAATAQVTNLGTNVGSRLGIGTTQGIATTNTAIAGGVDDVVKLGLATRALTVDQAAAIQIDAARGNGVRALNTAIQLMTVSLEGERAKVISTAEELKNTLGGAWDYMLNKLSNTSPIKTANENLTGFIRNLSYLFEKSEVPPDSRLGYYLNLGKSPTVASAAIPPPIPAAPAGTALAAASTANAQISQLIPEFAKRLDAWITDLSDADRSVLRVTSGYAAGWGHAADSNHYRGTAVDIRGLTPSAAASLGRFGLAQNVPGDWPHVDPAEIPSAATASVAARVAASKAFAAGATGTDVAAKTTADLAKEQVELEKLNRTKEDSVRLADLVGLKQQAETAFTTKYNEVIDRTKDKTDAWNQANVVFNEVMEKATVAAGAATREEDKKTAGILKSVDAFKTSEAEGYRAIALDEARIKVQKDGGDIATETRLALEAQAASALQAGQKQVAAAVPQIAAAERLAEAAKRGAGAQHEQQLQNDAATRTQDALAKAEASRNPVLIEQAKALNAAALAEIRRTDAAKNALAIQEKSINTRTDQAAVARLQIGLQGQTPEDIATQTQLLQEQQRLRAMGVDATSETAKNDLASVKSLGDTNKALAEAVRNQQRIDEGIRSIANTVDTTLTTSIEDAFNGKKVEDWGTRIKAMLGTLVSQISDALFIKPLLGSIIGALGFGSAAQSFGSFGSLLGGGGGGGLLGGLGGGGGGTTLTNSSGNVFTLSNASSVFSIGKSLFGGDSILSGLFGGGGSSGLGFLDTIGQSLGFATSLQGPTLSGASLGAGSVFGSTTLGTALGGIGAGFGAGTLLNSLVGGNTLGGTIGSGLGSVAGTIIGSLIGGPILGGIIGGLAGGGLGGMIGPKPSNFASGGLLTLGSGAISGVNSSGNAQNDQVSNQILTGVQSFTKNLMKLIPGAGISGSIWTNVGTRDGIIVGGNIGDLSGQLKFGSADEAVQKLNLEIARRLTGVSDTIRKVIDSITDPADLEAGIQFAATYDSLKKSFDAAFASITETKSVFLPFTDALDQINTTFKSLTESATAYGLSLEPITAGQAEAIKRLNTDFLKAVDDTYTSIAPLTKAATPFSDALAKLTMTFDDATTSALALQATQGLTGEQTGALFGDPINKGYADAVTRLLDAFNKGVNDSLTALTDPLAQQVETAKATGQAMLDDAIKIGADRVAVEKLNAATLEDIWQKQTQSLQDLRTQLTSGNLSGLTGAAATVAANDNFVRTLALVRGGATGQIGALGTTAQTALQQSQLAYGQGPQTASLRNTIITALDEVLSNRTFAAGTSYSPAGWSIVGERGPEFVNLPRGSTVLPSGVSPSGGDDLKTLLARVVELLSQGNNIGRQGFVETIDAIEGVSGAIASGPALVEPQRTKTAA